MRILVRHLALCAALLTAATAHGAGEKPRIVAGENFYGDIARQIAGPDAEVSSILNSPDQDPHLFETTPAVARDLAAARIVIVNGAGYDPWLEQLLSAAPRADRIVINAAELTGKKPGDNPHLWYDPPTAPAVVRALADALSKSDPERRADYEGRLKTFLIALTPIQQKITAMRAKYSGTAVTATEPVFGYVAAALGLTMRNERFQISVMNDTEPSAKDIAAFEDDLHGRKVKALFYNKQVTGKLTQRLLGLARTSHVPVVGVTETMPAGATFQDWITDELGDTERALAGPPS